MTSELKLDEGSDLVVTQGGLTVAFNADNAGGIIVTVRDAKSPSKKFIKDCIIF